MHRILLCLVLTFAASCHRDQNVTVIPAGAPITQPSAIPDQVEFRATGGCGQSPVFIKVTNDIDGTLVQPAVSLPFIATVQSTDPNLFVLISAQCNTPAAFGVLQVQIFINGRVFRDAYASGYGPLDATASGTWRR